MDWSKLTEALMPVLVTVATAAIGFLSNSAINWLESKRKATDHATKMGRFLDAIGPIAESKIRDIAETTTKGLKAKSADGRLTTEEVKSIKADVTAAVRSLPPELVEQGKALFGDFQQWAEAYFEKVYNDARDRFWPAGLKSSPPALAAPANSNSTSAPPTA